MPWLVGMLAWAALVAASWPAAAQGPARMPAQVVKDVDYLGPDRKETLDVWPTSQGRAPRPAVVLFHGGAWHRGTKRNDKVREMAVVLNEAGYVVFAADYQLSRMKQAWVPSEVTAPAWPRNLRDARAAVRFVRARAETYGVDPDRIAIGGLSAGAHLAMLVAFTVEDPEPGARSEPFADESSRVAAVLDLYGVAEVMPGWQAGHFLMFGPDGRIDAAKARKVLELASPLNHVGPHCPPVFIAHGAKDTQVDPEQSRRLAAALEEHGVPHELHVLPDEGHGFGFEPVSEPMMAFLEQHLAPTPSGSSPPAEPADG